MVASSHPSTVSFRGISLGSLLSISVTGSRAKLRERPWLRYYKTPDNKWKWKRTLICKEVTPGSCQVTFLGGSGLTENLVGTEGTLSISCGSSFSKSGLAVLEFFDITADVGELVRGQASFLFVEIQ